MNDKLPTIMCGKGRRYNWAPNEQAIFLVSSAEFDFAEEELGYLAGPPLHIHCQRDETHYILQGQLSYQIGKERVELAPGDYIHIPKGTPHAWINLQQESARIIAVLTPGGSEEFFRTVSSSPEPLDIEAQLKLAQEYDTEIVGPPLSVSLGFISMP